jgi:hypothetical protein
MEPKLSIKLVTKDYDFFAPLACGDVSADGINLIYERDTPNALDRTLADASIDAGELSLSRQLARLASGDLSFVGIPSFRSVYSGTAASSFDAAADLRASNNLPQSVSAATNGPHPATHGAARFCATTASKSQASRGWSALSTVNRRTVRRVIYRHM